LFALYFTPVTSLKTSFRNTGWNRHTRKINLSKRVTFSPERLCHSISLFLKKRLSFLDWKKLMSFSLIRRKQQLTRTVTLICWRLSDCLNVVDFIRAMTLSSCKTVFRQTVQKRHNSFYNRTPQTSCWWMGIIFSTYSLSPLDYCIWDILQDLVYEGRRLPFASLQDLRDNQKTSRRRSPLRQFENPLHNGKNDWMQLESRMGARFSTFSANRCDWISISCSETCWTYWLCCTFRTSNTLLRLSAVKQKRITS